MRRITAICAQRGISLFVFLITVFFLLLHKATGQNDLIVTSPVSGRHPRETRSIIGFFSNIVAHRVVLDPEWSIDIALNEVAVRVQASLSFSELPFQTIATSPELHRTPIDSTMFALHNTPDRVTASEQLSLKPYRTPRKVTDAAFSLSVVRRRQRHLAFVSYRKQSYSEGLVSVAVSRYVALLDAVSRLSPDTRLEDIAVAETD